MRIPLRQYLLLLVEHGGRLIWLSEHVIEGASLLFDLVVLSHPVLSLQLIDEHTVFIILSCVHMLFRGRRSIGGGSSWFF